MDAKDKELKLTKILELVKKKKKIIVHSARTLGGYKLAMPSANLFFCTFLAS